MGVLLSDWVARAKDKVITQRELGDLIASVKKRGVSEQDLADAQSIVSSLADMYANANGKVNQERARLTVYEQNVATCMALQPPGRSAVDQKAFCRSNEQAGGEIDKLKKQLPADVKERDEVRARYLKARLLYWAMGQLKK